MRLWSFSLVFLAVLGLLLILVGGDVVIPIGIVLMGGAAVGAVSLGFFAVGRSEDRAREAEAAARGPQPPPDAERPGDGRITARRPPRSRGDSWRTSTALGREWGAGPRRLARRGVWSSVDYATELRARTHLLPSAVDVRRVTPRRTGTRRPSR